MMQKMLHTPDLWYEVSSSEGWEPVVFHIFITCLYGIFLPIFVQLMQFPVLHFGLDTLVSQPFAALQVDCFYTEM